VKPVDYDVNVLDFSVRCIMFRENKRDIDISGVTCFAPHHFHGVGRCLAHSVPLTSALCFEIFSSSAPFNLNFWRSRLNYYFKELCLIDHCFVSFSIDTTK